MTNCTDKGLETDDPVVAAMFYGEEVEILYDDGENADWIKVELEGIDKNIFLLKYDDLEILYSSSIRIPWKTVWRKIQPVEGEPFVREESPLSPSAELQWLTVVDNPSAKDLKMAGELDVMIAHKRALNIVNNADELRELIARAKEAGK